MDYVSLKEAKKDQTYFTLSKNFVANKQVANVIHNRLIVTALLLMSSVTSSPTKIICGNDSVRRITHTLISCSSKESTQAMLSQNARVVLVTNKKIVVCMSCSLTSRIIWIEFGVVSWRYRKEWKSHMEKWYVVQLLYTQTDSMAGDTIEQSTEHMLP